MKKVVCRSYSIETDSAPGESIEVSETPSRREVVVSISRRGESHSTFLSKEEWRALCSLEYQIEVVDAGNPEEEVN